MSTYVSFQKPHLTSVKVAPNGGYRHTLATWMALGASYVVVASLLTFFIIGTSQ